ncbi:MAG: hypothetical protein JXA57_05850 [Armatimonadetes bacterium]|nr:hypothetical protein [Armatimonadota bacterium]
MTASIGGYLDDAIEKICRGDLQMAASSVCIAVAGTAKRAFPSVRGDSNKFKAFLARHMGLIVYVGMPGLALARGSSIRLRFLHPDVPEDAEGYCTLEDILYHVLRCGLIHEAEFPNAIAFDDCLSADGRLPKGILNGLILAVVVAPENKDERLAQDWTIKIKDSEVVFNEWWGKEQELAAFLGLRFLSL